MKIHFHCCRCHFLSIQLCFSFSHLLYHLLKYHLTLSILNLLAHANLQELSPEDLKQHTSYFAGNVLLDTYFAVKVLKVDFVSYQNFRSQFLDNSKKIARVKHQDRVEIVTDCLKGNSLKELIKKKYGKRFNKFFGIE